MHVGEVGDQHKDEHAVPEEVMGTSNSRDRRVAAPQCIRLEV